MEKKINIAELLKNCPKGMELDCTMFDNVSFVGIQDSTFSIIIHTLDGYKYLNAFGCYHNSCHAKCVIFPKGKTTWEGFQRPFVDGDIVYGDNFCCSYISIYKSNRENNSFYCYASLDSYGKFKFNDYADKSNLRFATEEEKEKLFQAIKEHGYQWNAKTKTLEKLIKPVFKIGDKISLKCEDLYWDIKTIEGDWYICTNGAKIHIEEQHHYELVLVKPKFKVGDIITNGKTFIAIGYIDDEYYYEISRDIAHRLCIKNQDEWELVPNKFDINTLKTFDQVLVRLTNNCVWTPKLFYYYDTNPKVTYYPFVTTDNIGYPQCIPYNGNEHLCRTTNNCDEFYRVWER